MSQNLEIIDENENILGTASREEIHEKGLLHREIHILLYASGGKIIFQKRALTKDTAPGKLDATVGGHVEIGMTPFDTALLELKEETGVIGIPEQLQEITHYPMRSITEDSKGNTKINNVIRYVYAYPYKDSIEALSIEEGKADGFVAYTLEELIHVSSAEKEPFTTMLVSDQYLEIYKEILNNA